VLTHCHRYGTVAGAKQAPDREPVVSVNYGSYPPPHSADSDTSAYGAPYDQYAYSGGAQQQPPARQQQQQFGGAAPAPQAAYGQPVADRGSGGGAAYGQQPSFMDYAPQQSYAASSYQTLPYTSAAAVPQVRCKLPALCSRSTRPTLEMHKVCTAANYCIVEQVKPVDVRTCSRPLLRVPADLNEK